MKTIKCINCAGAPKYFCINAEYTNMKLVIVTCEECEQRWRRAGRTGANPDIASYIYFDSYEEAQVALIKRSL